MNGKWTKDNFETYHLANPEVFRLFEKFALQIAARRKKYSAKAIFHRIRWEVAMTKNETEEFKIDDGWISHYARLFVELHPRHVDLFEFRYRQASYHAA
tara:strand:- start:378 stop:674 length:297 start_codon:yes stop_codon:yes gene_type:complete